MTEPVVESSNETTTTARLLEAKALLNSGRRNYLIKNYDVAADELSEVCSIYEELNGPLCDELGMPYLLYAKCLIFLAVDETKVLDVPDEENEDEEDDDDDEEDNDNEVKELETKATPDVKSKEENQENGVKEDGTDTEKLSSPRAVTDVVEKTDTKSNIVPVKNDMPSSSSASETSTAVAVPTSDNTENEVQNEAEENEAANDLQIAWETLELAGKIFTKQGMNGLPNLAEVHTELGNIEFENNIPEKAREDFEKALLIYKELPIKTYRRAMAEVNYKIGLTYILQESAEDGVESFKSACDYLNDEINDIKQKEDLTQKDKDNIQDMEETQQEIIDKITEIEETKQQCVEKVRAALDNFITPVHKSPEKPITAASIPTAKPNDISHLIKRKKQGDAEEASPAKRPAL